MLLGWHFDFANVIVLPMLLGMGIDNGVHLVHRHRTNPEEEDVLASSTARAVWFAAVTTVLSFGSLAFASHRGMASLGRLLTLGVAATLICYVVVLPAVLAWDDERARRSEQPAASRRSAARPDPRPARIASATERAQTRVRVVVGEAARLDRVGRELGTGVPAGQGARLREPRLRDVVVEDDRRSARLPR